MTQCWVSWKWTVACWRGAESQQPTLPQKRHRPRSTHRNPSSMVLRAYLRWLNYSVAGWELGTNLGPTQTRRLIGQDFG